MGWMYNKRRQKRFISCVCESNAWKWQNIFTYPCTSRRCFRHSNNVLVLRLHRTGNEWRLYRLVCERAVCWLGRETAVACGLRSYLCVYSFMFLSFRVYFQHSAFLSVRSVASFPAFFMSCFFLYLSLAIYFFRLCSFRSPFYFLHSSIFLNLISPIFSPGLLAGYLLSSKFKFPRSKHNSNI
jgi:hypothetical protein